MLLTSGFQWLPEYDGLLSKIASDDIFDSDWNLLRDIIKYKIEKNIALFLSETIHPPPPPAYQPVPLPLGGMKYPPFPPRKPNQMHMNVIPMKEDQANEMKGFIFAQLDEFDSQPPFTIQRVCELCLNPRQHYNVVGKYLRAVEKSLLVTSNWNSFPPLSETETDPTGRSVLNMGSARHSAPMTPLFSPIPFLHDDARRSKSRSPPPSPLALGSAASIGSAHPEAMVPRALGLVDELDDPSPGHMSEHPTALSSVTAIGDTPGSRPLLGSLEERFVKAEDIQDQLPSDEMVLDDDKENTKS